MDHEYLAEGLEMRMVARGLWIVGGICSSMPESSHTAIGSISPRAIDGEGWGLEAEGLYETLVEGYGESPLDLDPCPSCGGTQGGVEQVPPRWTMDAREWVARCGNPSREAETIADTPEQAVAGWDRRI